MTRSAVANRRLRNEGWSTTVPLTYGSLTLAESWVEISSQPSSSSLSSIGDEIVTTGLRVSGHPSADPPLRRRRVSHPSGATQSRIGLAGGTRGMSMSSQEEYEESSTESEDDRVMTSSNEHIASFARVPPVSVGEESNNSGEESDDDDENATALGLRVTDNTSTVREQPFTPQPNAFSHPPSSQQRSSMPGSYFPRTNNSNTPTFQQRQSYPGRPSRTQHSNYGQSHSPYNAISPSHHYRADDHDAALRASLTTLLSCAAAARGLPKRNQNGVGVAGAGTSNNTGTSTRPEFTGLRLVPESELTGTRTSPPVSGVQPPSRAKSSPSASDQERDRTTTVAADKGKRKVTPTTAAGKPSTQKKKRLAVVAGQEEAMISPTLLTWVVSASVVVLVSVVGFGAGYAMGREAGRQEGMSSLGGLGATGGGDGTCGKEVGRSVGELRKLRFGAARGIVA